jgi:hypothetical protein
MITQFRVWTRLQRFELVAAAIVAGVLAVSAILVRARLDAIGVTPDCWDAWFNAPGTGVGACEGPVRAFLGINEEEAGKVMASMALLPLAIGVFLGVPIVAREIEGGTAPAIWALARSRSRWLAGRLVPPVVVAVALLGALAAGSEVLWSGREPWSPAVRFGDAGLHGPVVVAKGLATMGLGVLAGAVIGRTLPAVIVAAILAVGLYMGAGTAQGIWMLNESQRHAVELGRDNQDTEVFPGGTHFWQAWRTADGRVLDHDAAAALAPEGADPWAWMEENLTPVMMGVPGSEYPTWQRIETTGFVLVGLAGFLGAFVVVARRRPL